MQTRSTLICLLSLLVSVQLTKAGAGDSDFIDRNDHAHGHIRMGVSNSKCDDGVTRTSLDWDESSHKEYSCTAEEETTFKQNFCSSVTCPSPKYVLNQPEVSRLHKCMNKAIDYPSLVPTSGAHRPLWPVWGQYVYLPTQRWLHSLEHGGIVALYHPCLPKNAIEKFATLVSGCLYRHVISPNKDLTADKPYVLVAWNNKAYFSTINRSKMKDFIREHALQGPEQLSAQGQYKQGLLKQSVVVTDEDDSGQLCPDQE